MVQINRGSILASRTRAIRRGLSGLMRFTLMSAAIPLVFFIRHYISPGGGFLLKPTIHEAFQQYNPQYDARLLTLLERVEYSGFFQERTSTEYGSVAELYYCSFPSFPSQWRKQQPSGAYFWLNFTAWVSPVINQTIETISKRNDLESLPDKDAMEKELLLQLLEIYAQDQPGLCDYQRYQPTIPTTDSPDRKMVTNTLARLSKSPQLVISIIAHRDVPQLQRLIQSLPDHRTVILIHLERPRDENARDVEHTVREWAKDYNHVHVLSFGSVIYGTGSVTHIQWSILHWLLREVKLSFDYFVTLDGASFPLHSPTDLPKRLQSESQGVWLGPMLHQGHSTDSGSPPLHLLRHKRLFYTTTHPQKDTGKFTQRLPRNLMPHQVIPESIGHALQHKSHSGNTAVYHRSVLEKLVDSAEVQQLMALSKYSVNCCLEEHVWVAALALAGLPIPEKSAVVQSYGGTSATCESSKHNAIWTRNATICYKLEDALLVKEFASNEDKSFLKLNQTAGGHVMNGNSTATLLQKARGLDYLFVRKFESSHAESMDLLRYIQETLW